MRRQYSTESPLLTEFRLNTRALEFTVLSIDCRQSTFVLPCKMQMANFPTNHHSSLHQLLTIRIKYLVATQNTPDNGRQAISGKHYLRRLLTNTQHSEHSQELRIYIYQHHEVTCTDKVTGHSLGRIAKSGSASLEPRVVLLRRGNSPVAHCQKNHRHLLRLCIRIPSI